MSNIGNLPTLSINKSVDLLTTMYSNVINNGIELKKIPSVMLWSSPGIGKSQSIRQLANNLEDNTHKKVVITDVRLILFNPVDLRGIPTSNQDKTLAVWLKPKIFDMDSSDDVINILFLDEITSASPSVQAAAYQITLDRTVGEHKLPDNCIVIAAGNRITDKAVAYQMPSPLANRFMHFEIESEFESWNAWAILNGINPKVLGFLKFKPNYLNTFDNRNTSLAFATGRTWEMVSNILNNVSDDVSAVFEMIAGLIGTGIATEFRGWARVFKDLPDIKAIFEGKETTIPTNTDTIYALTSAMVNYAKKHKDEMNLIENSIKYAMQLPPDFSLLLLKDYMYLDKDYKVKLLRIPEYEKWVKTRGRLLDGSFR